MCGVVDTEEVRSTYRTCDFVLFASTHPKLEGVNLNFTRRQQRQTSITLSSHPSPATAYGVLCTPYSYYGVTCTAESQTARKLPHRLHAQYPNRSIQSFPTCVQHDLTFCQSKRGPTHSGGFAEIRSICWPAAEHRFSAAGGSRRRPSCISSFRAAMLAIGFISANLLTITLMRGGEAVLGGH
ncbi:hypothetical protein ASPZODRAFT_318390 [Penicilliopsis zonata CBS 506.65]|uniref:Uncharacterized protein n=1 Tax=Penicilliopsis zonata CBS 506.65 TaxID=1073090 RepID=A0A1L9SV52_9EURO|nr:hypothetical protein ASPZODRAFT_318390 [Penicilliopsis zonata CBS 506.65]OJJ51095.1 hypothetical protein ASPZODRAFT_318390 [Penicilliopsis zonata CBS 506.65]